jgi:hypothetical protein
MKLLAPRPASLLLLLLIATGLSFGQVAPPPGVAGPATVSAARPSTANEQARFLSGLRLPPGSSLEPLQHTPEYLDHTRAYATTWRKFDNEYFGKMRSFSAGVLDPRIGSPQALYYFFSGPDFINAYGLFPEVPVYILVGLESVGSVVPPEQLDPVRIKTGLENLRRSTLVTLQFSFFITKSMKTDLEQTDFKGVLPIIESFIALGGGTITSISPFSPGGGLPGVCIRFRKNPSAPEQAVYYIRADLSNESTSEHGALLSWMSRFHPAVGYLKAASYLLHESYFSHVRDFLLQHCDAILQDDSGIPLRYYVASGPWQITLFGKYDGTLDLFKKYFQPDLVAAYAQDGASRLDFGTGYKWRKGESNLLLAVHQAGSPHPQAAAAASEAPAANNSISAPPANPGF